MMVAHASSGINRGGAVNEADAVSGVSTGRSELLSFTPSTIAAPSAGRTVAGVIAIRACLGGENPETRIVKGVFEVERNCRGVRSKRF